MAVNWLAVLAAALSMFAIGGIWYSPKVFGRQWQAAAGPDDERLKSGHPAAIFGLAFVFSFPMAANLGFFLAEPEITLTLAIAYAVAAGLGWAALGLGVVALFERRPPSYFLINGGYLTIAFAVMGLILGLWR
jgi:hypothetical protein